MILYLLMIHHLLISSFSLSHPSPPLLSPPLLSPPLLSPPSNLSHNKLSSLPIITSPRTSNDINSSTKISKASKHPHAQAHRTPRGTPRGTRRLPKLNLLQKNLSLNDSANDSMNQKKQQVLSYFLSQLQLFADLCLDRNLILIAQIEQLLPFEYLLSILCDISIKRIRNENLIELYSTCVELVIHLYVGREIESIQCLPSFIKLYHQIIGAPSTAAAVTAVPAAATAPRSFSSSPLPSVSAENKKKNIFGVKNTQQLNSNSCNKFSLLQHLVSIELNKLLPGKEKGKEPGKMSGKLKETEKGSTIFWSKHLHSIIHLLQRLIAMRCYDTKEKLNDIIQPILMILDRRDTENDPQSNGIISHVDPSPAVPPQEITIPWEKIILNFMESIPELILVMSIVCISTLLSILQMILPSLLVMKYNQLIDIVILLFFALEVTLRGYCHYQVRKKWLTFFKDPFIQLDLSLVLLDIILMSSESALGSLGSFTSLLRILRMSYLKENNHSASPSRHCIRFGLTRISECFLTSL